MKREIFSDVLNLRDFSPKSLKPFENWIESHKYCDEQYVVHEFTFRIAQAMRNDRGMDYIHASISEADRLLRRVCLV